MVGALCSEKRVSWLMEAGKTDPGIAGQKFFRLLAHGLAKNGAKVSTLSAIPVNSNFTKKLFWWHHDTEQGIEFHYVPFINFSVLRHLCLLVFSFLYILGWGIGNRKEKRLVVDGLSRSMSMAALAASKINRVKTCCILTDLPTMLSDGAGERRQTKIVAHFDSFVVLTKAMNEAANTGNRPSIVIEGMVDNDYELETPKTKSRNIVYAGILQEIYGGSLLINGFLKSKVQDVTLDLYGLWRLPEELKTADPRVRYHGIVPNNEIVQKEREATLLINPRPTNQEFTKYSFPSKNMEYMLSGTPLLTTSLPGMPEEYKEHVYLLENETEEGMAQKIDEIFALPQAEHEQLGCRAQTFVHSKKNNVIQAQKLIKLLEQL